jgi:hypothetical protein
MRAPLVAVAVLFAVLVLAAPASATAPTAPTIVAPSGPAVQTSQTVLIGGTADAGSSIKIFEGTGPDAVSAFTVDVTPPAAPVIVSGPAGVDPPAAATPTPAPLAPKFRATLVVKPVAGIVEITWLAKDGAGAQTARFSGGMFKVAQSSTSLALMLSAPLAACGSSRAATPPARRLRGERKGSFRVLGRTSVATTRGTSWLVEDSCAGTLTRVTPGTVSVRDTRRHKTVTLRTRKLDTARREIAR